MPITVLQHLWEQCLGQDHTAEIIDLHDPPVDLQRCISRFSSCGNSPVVHQDIQTAHSTDGVLNHAVDVGLLADVGLQGFDFAA